MTTSSSVLAFLASRFATHPENLATEALNFILAASPSARAALLDLCRQLGHQSRDDLSFTTQRANDCGSRPDLVGRAADGSLPLVIEAKFWAGLTSRQPRAYLDALPENGLLLFVAPAARTDTLWPELLRRVHPAGATYDCAPWPDSRAVRIGSRALALVSWRALLAHLSDACALVGDGTTADIRQLAALCEKMDSEAFLPLRSEELTSNLGRRVYEFCDLAEKITDHLVARRLANVKGLRATGGKGWFGKYMRFRGHGALLYFDARRWSKHGQSPLWLALYGREFKSCTVEPDCLREKGIAFHMSDGHCLIPIVLIEGAERDAVIDHAREQILQVMDAIPDLGAQADTAPPELDDPGMAPA